MILAIIATHWMSVITSALVKSTLRSKTLLVHVGCNSDSLDVCNDISSRIGKNKVEDPIDLGDNNVPCTVDGTFSLE